MQKRHIVGLTGPSGAGKSSLAVPALELGFFYIDADQVARIVTARGGAALPPLCEAFGTDILLPDGTLDRAALAARAFATPQATAQLNAITLPLIVAELERMIEKCELPDILLDAPTLFESGVDRLCDTVIGVLADREIRLQRIIARDGIDRSAAMLRLNAGKPDDFYLEKCQHILYNNNDAAAFLSDARQILNKILTESS